MLVNCIADHPAFFALQNKLKAGRHLAGLGLSRAARLPVTLALADKLRVPIFLLQDRPDHALTALDELGFWSHSTRALHFSEPTPMFYENASWGNNTRQERLMALGTLAQYHIPGAVVPSTPPVIMSTVKAVMARTLPRRDFLIACKNYKLHQAISPEKIQRHIAEIGYQSSEVVVEPGQFSRRGGILDIWGTLQEQPMRFEFFGDEIDTLREFDPATQRTTKKIDQLLITPAREVLPSKAQILNSENSDISEFLLPQVYSQPASILDYLPKNTLILIDDLSLSQTLANEIEEQAVKLRAESIQEGTLAEDFPLPYLTWSEIRDQLGGHQRLELGYSTAEEPSPLARAFEPGPRFAGRLKQVIENLQLIAEKGERTIIVSRQVQRIKDLWQEDLSNLGLGVQPEFHEGSLTEGWIFHQTNDTLIHLYTDSEIFGWDRPIPRQRSQTISTAPEDNYADLKPGDWVVHVDFGVGRYLGLVKRSLEGVEKEFLCVEYEGGDQIFVPIHQADRLSRYIGPDETLPTATHLGTADWNTQKQKVKEAVREVARDLLQLYTKRQVAKGFAFSSDSTWQQELEAGFPYIETADQVRAISETKRDMEISRPMDRLLCGDVGYGKTEVALRAAFKAVNDGKQVAVLVPTTVLAQQHFETFQQRLQPFPVTVEMLSRFRTPREQDEILLKSAMGEVDIIIGTHRLLQADVQFKDLGLVIIDEEQKFGVTHKEHFKKLRTEVDVLTLTATPIPRTLYMALTGVRDISVINTPPAERLPIITHIGPYSPKLVRQAIVRELERGGQVFFLHNRVQTIDAMKHHLNNLVPEARIDIAHGQMPEMELSSVMHRFTHAEIDVLLCTSIIENGLDIPNANTLIVDRGDTFGLAQLYQLRGRVGRGAQRAYAYFFRHKRKPPTKEGQERLEIIAENSQLGAGYSIAMRDLEMRGAGDMLGTRQSGYIASIGFHLYTRMLAQSVREFRKTGKIAGFAPKLDTFRELPNLVTVDLPMSIGIPLDYVSDQTMRLKLYRRLADLQSEDECDAMQEEFKDRFGPLPDEIKNLMYYLTVKVRAERAGLASVAQEEDQIVLRFPGLPEGAPARKLPGLPFARAGKNAYWMPYSDNVKNWKGKLLDTITAINELRIG
jgi:transcription-repair coupling factor (superfamily II helicase)